MFNRVCCFRLSFQNFTEQKQECIFQAQGYKINTWQVSKLAHARKKPNNSFAKNMLFNNKKIKKLNVRILNYRKNIYIILNSFMANKFQNSSKKCNKKLILLDPCSALVHVTIMQGSEKGVFFF